MTIKAKSTMNDDVHDITPQELADWKSRGILGEVVESDTHDKHGELLATADAEPADSTDPDLPVVPAGGTLPKSAIVKTEKKGE